MSLIEKEYREALDYMQCGIYNTETFKYYVAILEQLIEEHFELLNKYETLKKEHSENQLLEHQRVCEQKQEMLDEIRNNQPLKLEELHDNMWVWDNICKKWIDIITVDYETGNLEIRLIKIDNVSYCERIKYQENCFYCKEVKKNKMIINKDKCEDSLSNLYYILSNCKGFNNYDYKYFSGYKINENLSIIRQLIHDHYKLIEDFKQLEKNYDDLYDNATSLVDSLTSKTKNIESLNLDCIKVLKNEPLKFEELNPGMWIWNNDIKKYQKIKDIIDYDEDFDEPAFFVVLEPNEYDCYVEGRFYRMKTKDND